MLGLRCKDIENLLSLVGTTSSAIQCCLHVLTPFVPVESYHVETLTTGVSGAKSRHSPGIPLNTCVPRSLKVMSDPAIKSLTVLDTRTSPGCAAAKIREPVFTVIPPMAPSSYSTSPAC